MVSDINKAMYMMTILPGRSIRSLFGGLLFLVAIFLTNNVFAQKTYYPGGLTNTNVSLWLNANEAGSIQTVPVSNTVASWNDISGNGYDARETRLMYGSYLTTSSALVAPGYKLSDIQTISGIMNGGAITFNAAFNALTPSITTGPVSYTTWIQFFDGANTKAVQVLFQDSNGGISATALQAKFASGNQTGNPSYFDTNGSPQTLVSSDAANGYGVKTLWFKLKSTAVLSASSNQPIYFPTGSTTGKPEIRFTRVNTQFLQLPTLASNFAPGALSVFSVARFNTAGINNLANNSERIFDFGNSSGSDNILLSRAGTSSQYNFSIYNGATAGDRVSLQNFTTSTTIFDVQASTTTPPFYFNGTVDNGPIGSNQTVQSVTRIFNYVGKSNFLSDPYLDGGVSELLLFNANLNNTQRILVEHYQAAQWGLLSSLLNLKYALTSTTTYNTSLLGIGRQSSSDNVPRTLSGNGFGLSSTIGAGNFLQDDGDYLLAAHNGQVSSTLNTGSVTASSVWNRSWYLTKTDVGTVGGSMNIYFDFNTYNGTTPPVGVRFWLLYRPVDGNFGSGVGTVLVPATTSAINGNQVVFTVNASNLSNGYYTIGYSAPMMLSAFTPTSGPLGATVVISGQNFSSVSSNNVVFFGATLATVLPGSTSSTLNVTVPVGANYQYISVTNLDNNITAYSAVPFVVTYATSVGSFNAFSQAQNISTGADGIQHVIKDFNNDGKPDVVVANCSGNTLYLFTNVTAASATAVTFTLQILTGINCPVPLTAEDLNGDGKSDLIANAYNGNGFIYQNVSSQAGPLSFTNTGLALFRPTFVVGRSPRVCDRWSRCERAHWHERHAP